MSKYVYWLNIPTFINCNFVVNQCFLVCVQVSVESPVTKRKPEEKTARLTGECSNILCGSRELSM